MEEKKIILTEPMLGKSNDFILKMYPILNNEMKIKEEIHRFLENENYNEYREIRDSLLWNDLIIKRHGIDEENYYYSLLPKGIEYIKQENPNYKQDYMNR